MADLEKRLLSDIDLKSYIWRRYIDDIFLIWEHAEECLKLFLEKINNIHPEIKFMTDWSYSSVSFLDVKVIMKDRKIITDFYVKPTDTHQYFDSSSCYPYHCEKVYFTAKLCNLIIESLLIVPSLIRDVTNYSIGYINGEIVKELLGKKYERHEKYQEMNC